MEFYWGSEMVLWLVGMTVEVMVGMVTLMDMMSVEEMVETMAEWKAVELESMKDHLSVAGRV